MTFLLISASRSTERVRYYRGLVRVQGQDCAPKMTVVCPVFVRPLCTPCCRSDLLCAANLPPHSQSQHDCPCCSFLHHYAAVVLNARCNVDHVDHCRSLPPHHEAKGTSSSADNTSRLAPSDVVQPQKGAGFDRPVSIWSFPTAAGNGRQRPTEMSQCCVVSASFHCISLFLAIRIWQASRLGSRGWSVL